MSLLSWFDNRTLFGCQCMLVLMFSLVFLWMGRVYPGVRGLRSTTVGFLLGIPCTLFLVQRGHISDFVSVVVANVLAVAAFAFLYDGVIRFIGGPGRLWELVGVSVIALGVVYYYSEVRHDIVPRTVAMGVVCALFRGMTAYALLRRATASPNRTTMQCYGIFMAALALINIERVVVVGFYGVPQNFMEGNAIQTSTIVITLLYIGVSGLCFLMMASHELVTRSQSESEHDPLSGAFNRRGIEARLAMELKRCDRSRQRLSVALLDIDYFKSINDQYGHGMGDAAIREVANLLSGRLRAGDYLGRYGGDEFLLVFPHTACNQALIVAERLSEAMSSTELQRLVRMTMRLH